MTKRVLNAAVSMVVIIMLCISLCSCDVIDNAVDFVSSVLSPKGMIEDTSLGYTEVDSAPFTYSIHYTPYVCRDSYDLLELDNMRRLYDMLIESVYFVYPEKNKDGEYKTRQVILENSRLSEAQIRLTVKALTDDNPQIFWLTSTFGYLVSEESSYTAVQLYANSSPDEINACVIKLKKAVNDFFLTLKSGMTDYQLEQTIHDMILDTCEYDRSITSDTKDMPKDKLNAFDPYGVMVNKKAVCEGYARTFQMLCNSVGIRCINIIGTSDGELHMWNAVVLGGDWYNVDATWDDTGGEGFEYDYFNINDTQLSADHEACALFSTLTDEEICGTGTVNSLTTNFYIPECNSTAYNYYVRNCAQLKDYDSDAVIKSLTTAAMKKQKHFSIYIDPGELSYDYAVDQLFYSYPQYFFNYVDLANASLPDYSIDKNNLALYKKESLNVVMVELEYI